MWQGTTMTLVTKRYPKLDPAQFAIWQDRFHFTIDVAASVDNHMLERYYTPALDGLAESWEGERVWCHPPYNDIAPWIAKAWSPPFKLVVMLLPANQTNSKWWQDLIEPHRDYDFDGLLTIEFLPGTIKLIDPRDPDNDVSPTYGSCLAIWGDS